jgi:hypothetical protein
MNEYEIGRIFINVVIIFAFSGPAVNCPGYERDPNVPCTTDASITSRNSLYAEYTNTTQIDNWCHEQCGAADFAFGMSVPQFAWLIAAINIVSLPSYVVLREDKMQGARTAVTQVFYDFWIVMKRRAVWQVMLYTMVRLRYNALRCVALRYIVVVPNRDDVGLFFNSYFHEWFFFFANTHAHTHTHVYIYIQISSITFNVYIAAKSNANFVWLGLSVAQNQILNIMEAIIFAVGLIMGTFLC